MDTKLIRQICDSHDEAPTERSWEAKERFGLNCPWVPCTPEQALMSYRNGLEVRRKPVTRTVTLELPVVSEEKTDFELRTSLAGFMERCFYFKTLEDRDEACTAICDALEQAKGDKA